MSEPLSNERYVCLTPQVRGESLALIKYLAYQSYLREGLGNKEDFEKLWQEAFFADAGAKDVLEKGIALKARGS